MMKSTITTHICDGCEAETHSPYGWRSFMPIAYSGAFFTVGGYQASEDYCPVCVDKMRLSLKKLVANDGDNDAR